MLKNQKYAYDMLMNLLHIIRTNNESSPNDLRLSDSHHRAKHAVTRFPRQRCRRPHAKVLCRRHQRHKYVSVVERPQQCSHQQLELVEGISPRGLTYLCTEKAGYINSARIWCTRSLGRLNFLDLLLRHNALVGGHPGPRKKADEHSSTR